MADNKYENDYNDDTKNYIINRKEKECPLSYDTMEDDKAFKYPYRIFPFNLFFAFLSLLWGDEYSILITIEVTLNQIGVVLIIVMFLRPTIRYRKHLQSSTGTEKEDEETSNEK